MGCLAAMALVKASGHGGFGHPLQGLHEGRHTQRHTLALVDGPHILEGIGHLTVQAHVDLLLIPLEVLQVLHPLKEAHRDASGVAVDVGEHGDAAVPQDEVALRGDGPVGRLRHPLALQVGCVPRVDDAAHSGRHQDITGRVQHLLHLHHGPAWEPGQQPLRGHVLPERLDVQAVLIEDSAVGVADGHHATARLRDELRRPRPHVSKALEHKAVPVHALARVRLQHLADAEHDAAPGGRLPAKRPVHEHRLASDHARGEALVLAVLIEEPGHDPAIRVHVWRRDVLQGADDVAALLHKPPGELLQLALAECLDIHADTALRSAKGNVQQGGLPCHQGGQGADIVHVHVRMVAQTALVGAAGAVVLHTEGLEGVDLAGVACDGQVELQLPVRLHQQRLQLLRIAERHQRLFDEEVGVIGVGRRAPAT
mmetsp:Transcript_46445/g.116151  ORF Transcript_46445/g.116151 Transcript_46445/m.116151 type:complete len:426 (-) Transcript_46445:196-1473(-)